MPNSQQLIAIRNGLGLSILMLASAAWGIDPMPPFDDPSLESSYQELINEVRCLVCQNQTIADSNAPLASDLRREMYLDKFLVTLRPYANRWKHKKNGGKGWKDDA